MAAEIEKEANQQRRKENFIVTESEKGTGKGKGEFHSHRKQKENRQGRRRILMIAEHKEKMHESLATLLSKESDGVAQLVLE